MEGHGRSKTTFCRQGFPYQPRRRAQDQGPFLSRWRQLYNSLRPQRYYQELTIWKRLKHPNVVPVFGANADFAEFCVVSPWMPEGELLKYLEKHPGANRVEIVRKSLPIPPDQRVEPHV